MYYTQENDLARDAKRTELEFANARVLVAKLKANFIGGKVPIARLVFMLLCVAALIVPFMSAKLTLPMYSGGISVGGIGIYNMINDSMYTQLLNFLKAGIAGDAALKVLIGLALFAVVVLGAAAMLIIYLLSFINIKSFAKKLFICSLIFAGVDIVAFVWGFIAKGTADAYGFLTISAGFGALVSLLTLAVFAFLNKKIMDDETPLPVKEVDYKRIEIYKKYKAGEISLDDLTMPIFETEEERQARLDALAGKKKEKTKKRGKKKKEEKNDG